MGIIRKSGGYRALRSFQLSTIIYDSTYYFCEKNFDRFSRMQDQMLQAARSGRQNIAEGSRASATSTQTELRLTNVARASMEELLLDYEDYIRQRRQRIWNPDSKQALTVRNIIRLNEKSWNTFSDIERYDLYKNWVENESEFVVANSLICLIHQTNYLLDKQILVLEKQFIEEGGYTEKLAQKRVEFRQKDSSSPDCPKCQNIMVVRTAKSGKQEGKQFWGCVKYPGCKGVLTI
ncbi:MAG: four helix bundle suffix domain-containing protein [Lentisphaeraceae bacterium]|nr:four helix bundle suffix domain-containing protein [Lentisphaeraceae bacterium]